MSSASPFFPYIVNKKRNQANNYYSGYIKRKEISGFNMIKGFKKRMVIVSGLNDSSIETAYFVIKEGSETENFSDDDIMKKANSIIEGYESASEKGEKRYSDRNKSPKYRTLISFLSGLITGFSLFFIAFLLLR